MTRPTTNRAGSLSLVNAPVQPRTPARVVIPSRRGNADAIGAGALGFLLPLLMGATGTEIPGAEGLPLWVQMMIAAVGPTLAAAFVRSSKTVRKFLATYVRAKGEAMLEDSDPKNDAAGRALIAGASELDADADPSARAGE